MQHDNNPRKPTAQELEQVADAIICSIHGERVLARYATEGLLGDVRRHYLRNIYVAVFDNFRSRRPGGHARKAMSVIWRGKHGCGEVYMVNDKGKLERAGE